MSGDTNGYTSLPARCVDFPYPQPYGRLPWRAITREEDLAMETWVWVCDRLKNIYPVRRTARGLEAPPELGLGAMWRAGLIEAPTHWLPWRPDLVEGVLRHMPGVLRMTRPNQG